jgi:hypothetical protein
MFRDEDAGLYLGHYTTAETFLTYILPTMKVRMSSFARVNDPRESRSWLCNLTCSDNMTEDELDIHALSARFTDYMKKTAKLLCLTRDDETTDNPNRLDHLYGRCYAHPSMWDRYANRHSGVCLMFDHDRLREAIARASDGRGNTSYYAPVSYVNQPSNEVGAFTLDISEIRTHGEKEVFREHQEKFHTVLYFQKSTDWSPECEFRWVVLDPDESELFIDIGKCLSGIVFGEAFPVAAIKMVAKILDEREDAAEQPVELTQMQYRNGHPIVMPAPVE